jgi:hypothetical protein
MKGIILDIIGFSIKNGVALPEGKWRNEIAVGKGGDGQVEEESIIAKGNFENHSLCGGKVN